MVLPVYVYGAAVLKKETQAVTRDCAGLQQLIANMWDTLGFTEGVGLAAPQVGHALRLLVIDASPFKDDYPETAGFRRVVLNPEILETGDEIWTFNEGCLSIPTIREDVVRPRRVRVRYLDEEFAVHEEWLDTIPARIFQHEYDHIEGILFTEHLPPIRRKLLSSRLQNIARGRTRVDYKTKI